MNEEIQKPDLGSKLLRDVILERLQPDTLEETLQLSKSTIDELYEKELLSRQEYDLLKEVPLHPDMFDIHLLTKIIKHIFPVRETVISRTIQVRTFLTFRQQPL